MRCLMRCELPSRSSAPSHVSNAALPIIEFRARMARKAKSIRHPPVMSCNIRTTDHRTKGIP